MNRRQSFHPLALGLLLPALGSGTANAEEAVTKSAKIIETLAPKDIILDRQGQPAPSSRRRADPSINLTVQFTFGSAELLPQGKRQLDELAMALGDARLAAAGFELACHTDRVGDATANLRLSLDRANAVRSYLIDAHGVSRQRLAAVGYGYDRLLVPGQPEAAANRRVEVRRLLSAAPAPQPPQGRLVPTPK